MKKSIARPHDNTCPNVKETERYLAKVGITLGELDGLSVIHVAGTKGKVRSLSSSTSGNVESSRRKFKFCFVDF